MSDLPAVDRDHPSRLGFAWECLLRAAIEMAELRQWAELMIMELDDPPPIFTYLLDFDDSKPRLYLLFRDKLVRGPWSGLSEQEQDALTGIALIRHPHFLAEG